VWDAAAAVVFEVSDTGPGIAAEMQTRVFDRFYRDGVPLAGEGAGSGLGLSIAKWAVEANGGELRLMPAPVGSTFRVTLPRATAASAPSTAPSRHSLDPAVPDRPRRLVSVGSRVLLAFAVAALLSPPRVGAHHPLRDYRQDNLTTIEGTLVGFVPRNPHSIVYLEVRDQNGQTERWSIEWAAALILKRHGITSETLAPGDRLVVTGFPSRNVQDHKLWLRTITRPRDNWKWTGGF
jgi:hypothetical protein